MGILKTVTLSIKVDNLSEYYTVADDLIIGNRYDDKAVQLKIIRPENEQDSKITLVFSDGNNTINCEDIGLKDTFDIINYYTENKYLYVGIVFINDVREKHARSIRLEFADAPKPCNYIPPRPPEKKYVEEAPSDGQVYGRQDEAWTPVQGADTYSKQEINEMLSEKVDVIIEPLKIYGTDLNGNFYAFDVSSSIGANSIALRQNDGTIQVGEPQSDLDATPMKWVNDKIGDINIILDLINRKVV